MKSRFFIALLVFTNLFAANAIASVNQDLVAITSVIQKYFDGTSQGKPELVTEAFLPSLEVQWIDATGNFRRRAGPEYIGNIKEGKSVPRFGHIVNIDVTNNIASAKVGILWNERQYTDYLLLIKIADHWKISNKIATWETK